jgi:hypothetical protein
MLGIYLFSKKMYKFYVKKLQNWQNDKELHKWRDVPCFLVVDKKKISLVGRHSSYLMWKINAIPCLANSTVGAQRQQKQNVTAEAMGWMEGPKAPWAIVSTLTHMLAVCGKEEDRCDASKKNYEWHFFKHSWEGLIGLWK